MSLKPKILIAAPAHPLLAERFASHGYMVEYLPDISYHELLDHISDAYGIVVTTRITIVNKINTRKPGKQA